MKKQTIKEYQKLKEEHSGIQKKLVELEKIIANIDVSIITPQGNITVITQPVKFVAYFIMVLESQIKTAEEFNNIEELDSCTIDLKKCKEIYRLKSEVTKLASKKSLISDVLTKFSTTIKVEYEMLIKEKELGERVGKLEEFSKKHEVSK